MMQDRDVLPSNGWTLMSVLFVSIVMIALQLVLMRSLSVTRYYHFSYLVISTALLGFGASGTLLTLFYDRMKRYLVPSLILLFFLFQISIPGSYILSQQLAIDTKYILYDTNQQLLMLLYNTLIFIPFFLGATLIGFFITYFRRNVSTVYGFNLLGSGIGGVIALGLMFIISPHYLPLYIVIFAFLSFICWIASSYRYYYRIQGVTLTIALACSMVIMIFSVVSRPDPTIDPHKELAHMKRLQSQGDAEHITRQFGPRALIDIHDSPVTHNTLFAGLQSRHLAPPQLSILKDGNMAGTIFNIDTLTEAKILRSTPQSLPYRLSGDSTRVLLLGESGGTNIWLASQFNASRITVVQTNPALVSLMKNKLSDRNGNIFNRPNVHIVTQSPRHFLEQTDRTYDIIQLAQAETMHSGSSGLQSLNENFLLTIESIREAFDLLSDDGFISITRGIETPPRDNIKIFAMFAAGLRESKQIRDPSTHLLQSRNYLAANTLISSESIDSSTIQSYRSLTDTLLMDNDYYPGIEPSRLDPHNQLEGPQNGSYSWYYHAAQQILFGNAEKFYKNWAYNVRPPTDNKPYFSNFFKWSSVERFINTYGNLVLQKLELGYIVLVITFLEISLIAFVLILLPLILRRKTFRRSANKLQTFIYFTATGIGFIFLEMVFIQKFTRFMGDPIYSIGAALTSFLVFAGLGSMIQKRMPFSADIRIFMAGTSVMILAVIYMLLLDDLFELTTDYPTIIRFLITVVTLFPFSFFLGWFFPAGIEKLEQSSPDFIPWAWGIDGFTSVAGAPLAVILSMTFGFNMVITLALIFYLSLMGTIPFWDIRHS